MPSGPGAAVAVALVLCLFAELALATRGGRAVAPRTVGPQRVAGRSDVDAHLAPREAVSELLAVFHQARFSHHPTTARDRCRAEQSLAEVSDWLEGKP